MATLSQKTFSGGEISPTLYARTDLSKYVTGLRTCLNSIVLRYGGVSNRPGTKFICELSDPAVNARLIPFTFNTDQTYMLELGASYMRVIKDGVLLTQAAKTITGVTLANPGVVTTSGAHSHTNGQEVVINNIVGTSELNTRHFKVANVTSTTFELQSMAGVNIDTSAYTAWVSGGESAEIFEVGTQYSASDVGELNYVQSADVITLVHPSYPPSELTRTSDTSWSFDDIVFEPSQIAPTGVTAVKGAIGAETYDYTVTAVSADTGEESFIAYSATTAIAISGVAPGISVANPCVFTVVSHSFLVDDIVGILFAKGMTEVNGLRAIVIAVTGTTVTVELDTLAFSTYTGFGYIYKCSYTLGTATVPTVALPHTVSWSRATGALEYNVYRRYNGAFGLIGITTGLSFKDQGLITPNTSTPPPTRRNPFDVAGNYPSTVTYIQQRLAFGNTTNDTEKVWLSKTGNFKNYTVSSPLQSDDAVTFKLAGRQVNAVKSLVDLGRLVILTSGGEWSAEGDAGIITPTTINTKQYSYNGSGDLQPIVIDGAAIYQQARGSIIRDLGFDFQVDGYKGNDLTIFSAHLFDKFTIVDWAYQQIPQSILWVVRSDGVLLGMTFVRNQEVRAWHRHDVGGTVERVSVIPEGNEDVLYLTVKRTVNGATVRYLEKLTSRQITDIKDSIFMDSSGSYDGRNTSATTMTLTTGGTWLSTDTLTLTASTSYFNSGDVGNAIHMTGASGDVIRATITAYTSATVVSVLPHKTVPTELQIAITVWTRAVDQVAGLWHLEGKDVSISADGYVVANPNNDSYDTITVTLGTVTLDKPYGVIHVGVPYLSDVETLDVDTVRGETLLDKKKFVSRVSMFVEDTRGIWTGPKPPTDDTVDPLENLTEVKIRSAEDYDSPVALRTDSVDVNIQAEWGSNGRVFVRQVDPVPMTILSISPSGKYPFSGG